MTRTVTKLAAAAAVALALGACNTAGDRAAGGAVVGGIAGAGIGGLAGGGQGALVGGLAGAATGAVVGAATAPVRVLPPVDGPVVYEPYADYGFERYHGPRPPIYREYPRPYPQPTPYVRPGTGIATDYSVPPPRVYVAPY